MAKVKKEEEVTPKSAVETPKAPAPPRVRAATRVGRLLPKNKSRLPRKAKKALQAKAAKSAAR